MWGQMMLGGQTILHVLMTICILGACIVIAILIMGFFVELVERDCREDWFFDEEGRFRDRKDS